jgi:heme-degrading monooxygenase HmoA
MKRSFRCLEHRTGKARARAILGAPALFPRSAAVIYSSTFIFAKKQFDDEFHRLDQQIAAAAKNLPGYLGEEAWENPATGLVSNVYYWSSLDALQQLMAHPAHLQAKAAQANWLAGYRVVISKVMRAYGDRDALPGVVAFETP